MNKVDSTLKSVLEDWPEASYNLLATIWSNNGKLKAEHNRALCELLECNLGQLMTALLPLAESFSLASTSGFKVGAVAMGNTVSNDGMADLFLGANIEFPNLPLDTTIHAEQCVSVVTLQHGQRISSLAVSVTPCGYCRQFLYEFSDAQPLPVSIGKNSVTDLNALLPKAFGPIDMGIAETSTLNLSINLNELSDTTSAFEDLAKTAAKSAYSPYSNNNAGCVISLTNGNSYLGRYLENAAYNPCINPFAAAICVARVSEIDFDFSAVEQCTFVESQENISLQSQIKMLLNACQPKAVFNTATLGR